jgi:hypothetical protein
VIRDLLSAGMALLVLFGGLSVIYAALESL